MLKTLGISSAPKVTRHTMLGRTNALIQHKGVPVTDCRNAIRGTVTNFNEVLLHEHAISLHAHCSEALLMFNFGCKRWPCFEACRSLYRFFISIMDMRLICCLVLVTFYIKGIWINVLLLQIHFYSLKCDRVISSISAALILDFDWKAFMWVFEFLWPFRFATASMTQVDLHGMYFIVQGNLRFWLLNEHSVYFSLISSAAIGLREWIARPLNLVTLIHVRGQVVIELHRGVLIMLLIVRLAIVVVALCACGLVWRGRVYLAFDAEVYFYFCEFGVALYLFIWLKVCFWGVYCTR